MGGGVVAPRPVSQVVSTLWVRVLTRCGHRSSLRAGVSTQTGLPGPIRRVGRRVRSRAGVRGCQDDPVVVDDVEEFGGQRPAECVVEGRRSGCRERDAAVRAQAEDHLFRGRGRRIDRLRAAGRQAGRSPVGRGEGGEVAVEARRVPAPRDAVEGVGARPDRLVRPTLPVDEVVPALVPGPRPVADLVAVPAVLGQAVDGVVVLRRGTILVLGRARVARQRRAPAVVGRWSPPGPVSPSASGSSSVKA